MVASMKHRYARAAEEMLLLTHGVTLTACATSSRCVGVGWAERKGPPEDCSAALEDPASMAAGRGLADSSSRSGQGKEPLDAAEAQGSCSRRKCPTSASGSGWLNPAGTVGLLKGELGSRLQGKASGVDLLSGSWRMLQPPWCSPAARRFLRAARCAASWPAFRPYQGPQSSSPF